MAYPWFLEADLPAYYPKGANMDADDKTTFIGRANAWAYGEIGGEPPTSMDLTVLKTAIGLTIELFAQGETAQTDATSGNITAAAPSGYYSVTKDPDPFDHVVIMLSGYKRAVTEANTSKAARGIAFL